MEQDFATWIQGLGPEQIATLMQGLSPEQIVDRVDRNDDDARAYVYDLQSLYQHYDSTKITSTIVNYIEGDHAPKTHNELWRGVFAIVQTQGAPFALKLAELIIRREEEHRLNSGSCGNEGAIASPNVDRKFRQADVADDAGLLRLVGRVNGDFSQDTAERGKRSRQRKPRILPTLQCPVKNCTKGGHKYLRKALKKHGIESPEEITRLLELARSTARTGS